MNYLIEETIKNESGIRLEIFIAIVVAILLVLSIIILTIIKKTKD